MKCSWLNSNAYPADVSHLLTPEANHSSLVMVELDAVDNIAVGEQAGYPLQVVRLWCVTIRLILEQYPSESFTLAIAEPHGDSLVGPRRYRSEPFSTRQFFKLMELNDCFGDRVDVCLPDAEARFGVNRADLMLYPVRFGIGAFCRPEWETIWQDAIRAKGWTLSRKSV